MSAMYDFIDNISSTKYGNKVATVIHLFPHFHIDHCESVRPLTSSSMFPLLVPDAKKSYKPIVTFFPNILRLSQYKRSAPGSQNNGGQFLPPEHATRPLTES